MQAQSLIALLRDTGEWADPVRVVASPKLRARETLAPLAAALGLETQIDEDLDERRHGESAAEFRERVREKISALEAAPAECVVWCSHLDWIEDFRAILDCDSDLLHPPYSHWSPAQFLVLHLDDLWRVVKFGRAT